MRLSSRAWYPRTVPTPRSLAQQLPPWCVVIGLGGGGLLSLGAGCRCAGGDLKSLAQTCGLRLLPALSGIASARRPACAFEGWLEGKHWKLREKGAATEILFLTTLDRVAGFIGYGAHRLRALTDYPAQYDRNLRATAAPGHGPARRVHAAL